MITPTEERQRIAAILTCEESRGRDQLARTLALETNFTPKAARKLLGAAPRESSATAEVRRILAYVPQNRLRAHLQAGGNRGAGERPA